MALAAGLFAAAALLSVLSTRVALTLAPRLGLVSRLSPVTPSSTWPVPLGGGVVLALILLAASGALHWRGLLPPRLVWALAPAALVGLVDDIFDLSALPKVGLELLALIPYLWLARRGPAGTVSAALWLFAAQNAWNYLDIQDSLAGWCAVFAFAAATFILPLAPGLSGPAALAAAASGAALGFLWWNRHPARIYLGDTGSLTLGMLFGVLVLETGVHDSHLVRPLLYAGAIPLFELAFIFSERTRRGISILRPSPDHFSLRMLAAGICVPAIIRRMRLAAAALAALGLSAALLRNYYALDTLSLFLFLAALTWAFRYCRRLSRFSLPKKPPEK